MQLDQNREQGIETLGRRTVGINEGRMIGENRYPRIARQGGKARYLGGTDDLVADQDIGDATGNHGLGLGHLLAANPDSAPRQLLARDHRTFVGLGMRAEAQVGPLGKGRHPLQVALESR